MRKASRSGLAVLAVIVTSCTSSGPTDLPSSMVTSLVINAPSSLIIHEWALLTVAAKTEWGTVPLHLVTWDTSDDSIASVSTGGVVTAHQRGRVTIGVTAGAVRAEVVVSVTARVQITPRSRDTVWHIALGDTLHLTASYVDVDGVPVEKAASVTWTSSIPEAVAVTPDGEVVGLVWPSEADIIASSADGADTARVQVLDVLAGLPATLRLAHGAVGLGPVTLVHNRGAAVTLSFAEFVDIPIKSGHFEIDAEGLLDSESATAQGYDASQSFGAMVRESDRLAIYVVGGRCCGPTPSPFASLVGTWDTPTVVPDDSVRVRLIQGWTSAGVVYVLPADAPADGLPQLCYFDPLDIWGYVGRPVGDLDFVAKAKYGPQYEPVRMRATPEAGQSVTYVLTESAQGLPGIVAFPEP